MTAALPAPRTPATSVLAGADADSALALMGLDAALLTSSLADGIVAAMSDYSPFAPTTALGLTRWIKSVDSLRRALDSRGWAKHDAKNAPRSISEDRTMAIALMSGDASTGHATGSPRTARPSRQVFQSEVKRNTEFSSSTFPIQAAFDLGGPAALTAPEAESGLRTWVLLSFWDKANRALLAELSLPMAIQDHQITRWETRIILPMTPLAPEVTKTLEGLPNEDIDFPVEAVS